MIVDDDVGDDSDVIDVEVAEEVVGMKVESDVEDDVLEVGQNTEVDELLEINVGRELVRTIEELVEVAEELFKLIEKLFETVCMLDWLVGTVEIVEVLLRMLGVGLCKLDEVLDVQVLLNSLVGEESVAEKLDKAELVVSVVVVKVVIYDVSVTVETTPVPCEDP